MPGTENWLADAVSRLHEPGKLDILCNWFNWTDPGFLLCWPFVLLQHMSYNAFLFVVPQVLRWINLVRCIRVEGGSSGAVYAENICFLPEIIPGILSIGRLYSCASVDSERV